MPTVPSFIFLFFLSVELLNNVHSVHNITVKPFVLRNDYYIVG